MIPDAEKVVGGYLDDHVGLTALGARASGRTPNNQSRPWVRVTQLDAQNVTGTSQVEHLTDHMLQLDCYAGKAATDAQTGQAEANLLARTVRAALVEMPEADLIDVVVNSVRFVGMLRLPDQDYEPARERVVLTAQVAMHP